MTRKILIIATLCFLASCAVMSEREVVIASCDGHRLMIEIVDKNIAQDIIDIEAGKPARYTQKNLVSIKNAKDIILTACLGDELTYEAVTAKIASSIIILRWAK